MNLVFEDQKFDKYPIRGDQIVAMNNTKSFVTLSYKPFAPFHSLVISGTRCKKLQDLPVSEQRDFWVLVQKTIFLLKDKLKAKRIEYSVQNGEGAGQTVAHVHCHVIAKDYESATTALDATGKDERDNMEPLTFVELAKQALELRQHYEKLFF
eukprot:GHVP01040191.1.p1 GENE.GHVP01040191.1~~GHVP01040191.1.p1  ORF type:complete len:153 (+),score=27.74 GHVP01040191.1:256-714(+)